MDLEGETLELKIYFSLSAIKYLEKTFQEAEKCCNKLQNKKPSKVVEIGLSLLSGLLCVYQDGVFYLRKSDSNYCCQLLKYSELKRAERVPLFPRDILVRKVAARF
jgi:hypothetical protein